MQHKLSVMMLSWEYPPRVIGGISPHIYFLSKHLAQQDVKVYVMTCDFPGAPAHEVIDGVEIYRIDSYKSPAPDFAEPGNQVPEAPPLLSFFSVTIRRSSGKDCFRIVGLPQKVG